MFERLPAALTGLDQWVCTNRGTKIPFRADVNVAASSTNPATWSPFAIAKQAVVQGYYDNLGFVFADNGYVGIDVDAGYDSDGFLTKEACEILGICKSYTEKSRSGRGFHILLKGDLPFKGQNNQKGVEIYKTARYFIMTGQVLLYDQIVEDQDAIDYIVRNWFPEAERMSKEGTPRDRVYQPVWNRPQGGRIPLRPTYPTITSGSRNLSLTSLGGHLRNIGYSKAEIFKELQRANQEACKPMLSKGELMTIAASVSRYKR